MKVIVVEDEHKIARAVKQALEFEGIAVDVVYDSEEALKKATEGAYDVAIVDQNFNGKTDGLGIVSALREARVHTPVLLLGTSKKASDRKVSLNAGADDYIVKPFALATLIARVQTLAGEDQATMLTAGDLTVDTVTYEVKRGGTLVSLTNKEFSLLEFMLRHPGRPLNKELIISHVWDYEADILPNTVEVYVKYLRNKVDEPFATPLIHTARGFGYKLEA